MSSSFCRVLARVSTPKLSFYWCRSGAPQRKLLSLYRFGGAVGESASLASSVTSWSALWRGSGGIYPCIAPCPLCSGRSREPNQGGGLSTVYKRPCLKGWKRSRKSPCPFRFLFGFPESVSCRPRPLARWTERNKTPAIYHPGGLSLPHGVSPALPPQCRKPRATQDAYSWLQRHRRWWRTKLRRELGLLTPPGSVDQAVLCRAVPCFLFSFLSKAI